MEVNGQLHAVATLTPGKVSDTHCIGGWVDPRAGLDTVTKRKIKSLTLSETETQPSSP